jgi:hypothetical protein
VSNGNLRIDFDGLVSLVPLKPAQETRGASTWLAALPDLRQTLLPTPQINVPLPIAPHMACLIVPDEAVVDIWSTKMPSMVFAAGRDGGKLHRLYELKGHGLKLDYSSKSGLKAISTVKGAQAPTTSADAQDLAWVAPLSEVGLPGAGVFDAALIEQKHMLPADPSERKVAGLRGLAGLVTIDSGTLRVEDVVRSVTNGKPVVFKFRPMGHSQAAEDKVPHEQAQGTRILLEDDVSDNVRLIFGRRNAGGPPQFEEVVLRPQSSGLHLRVANMELEEVLGLGNPFEPVKGGGVFPDPDFAIHYMLSKAWPFPSLPVPHLVGTKESGKGGSDRETCKGSRFAGLSGD